MAAVDSECSVWDPDFAEKLFALDPLGVDTPTPTPPQLIHIPLTGFTRSPDLHAITQTLGTVEVPAPAMCSGWVNQIDLDGGKSWVRCSGSSPCRWTASSPAQVVTCPG